MNILETVFDTVLPSHEELSQRGDPEVRTQIVDDRLVTYADYGIGVDSLEYKVTPFRSHSGRALGKRAVGIAYMSDGAHRSFAANLVEGDSGYIGTRGTAWFTTATGGYGQDRMDSMAAVVGVDTVHVGPAFSHRRGISVDDIKELKDAAQASLHHSLPRAAQAKQAVFRAVIDEFSLPRQQLKTGCSMDANETAAEYAYAAVNGIPIIQHDLAAPAGMDRHTVRDLTKFATWMANEAVTMGRVGFEKTRHGRICEALGTFSLNPLFLTAAVVGNGRALAAGARPLLDLMPTDAHGHQTIYLGDTESVGADDTYLSTHPNVYKKYVLGGHGDLARQRAKDCQLARLVRYDEQFRETGGDVAAIDRVYVYQTPFGPGRQKRSRLRPRAA